MGDKKSQKLSFCLSDDCALQKPLRNHHRSSTGVGADDSSAVVTANHSMPLFGQDDRMLETDLSAPGMLQHDPAQDSADTRRRERPDLSSSSERCGRDIWSRSDNRN